MTRPVSRVVSFRSLYDCFFLGIHRPALKNHGLFDPYPLKMGESGNELVDPLGIYRLKLRTPIIRWLILNYMVNITPNTHILLILYKYNIHFNLWSLVGLHSYYMRCDRNINMPQSGHLCALKTALDASSIMNVFALSL